jgi:hypothetical protein
VQTVNNGLSGEPEAGDVVVLTYGGVVNPDLILSGWDGSTTTVTAHIGTYNSDDWLYFMDAADSTWLSGLGGVDLVGDYANPAGATFTNSQMTLAGSTVTIVLGTASNHIRRDTSAQDMVWWTYHGNVGESGLSDQNF